MSVPIVFAEVGYYEPWWIQILKGLVIFAIGLPARAGRCLLGERKLSRPLPARSGPQPRRSLRLVLAADGDIGQAAVQAAVPARRTSIGWLFRARHPAISMARGGRDDSRSIPFSDHRSTSSARRSPDYGDRPEHRDPVRRSPSAPSLSTG
jgi:NADH-quinone oxidoreductase subunit H